MHRTTQNPVIWTEELVYSNSSSGKLGEKVDETLREFPHQSLIDYSILKYLNLTEVKRAIPSCPHGRGLIAQWR
ncbi:MAG TPA: hypothetical protein ENH28_05540 [Euryarchaeota archaeon]|nr:hypothetical protein [Euryarchaeota archaeon]